MNQGDLANWQKEKDKKKLDLESKQSKKLDDITILLSRLCDLHEDHEGRSAAKTSQKMIYVSRQP